MHMYRRLRKIHLFQCDDMTLNVSLLSHWLLIYVKKKTVNRSGNEVTLAPVGSAEILTLPENSSLDALVDVLRQLGCLFLSRAYELPTTLLCDKELVYAFSLKGILTVLGRMPAERLTSTSAKLPHASADTLRAYAVSKCGELVHDAKSSNMTTTLKSLSIYPLRAPADTLVTLTSTRQHHPLIPPDDLQDTLLLSMRPFLRVINEEESVFYKHMGLRRTDSVTCVREVFMPELREHAKRALDVK